MKTYEEYYNLAREAAGMPTPAVDLYSFTHEIVFPDSSAAIIESIPEQYIDFVKKVAKTSDHRLANDDLCYWPPGPDGISKDNDLVRFCKDFFDIDGLEEMAQILMPQIEKNLFGCNVQVQNLYIYRNNITDRDPRMSWLWHFDNHPYEYMKCMIYLTDVDEDSAPLEFLQHKETKELFKHNSTRTSFKEWKAAPNNSRVSPYQMDKLKEMGFEPTKVCGPAGTVIIFNENVIHRATTATKSHRDVVNFLIKPSIEKLSPYINKEHTGGLQNKDMFMDPSHRGLIFK
tara:strand:- start:873 stop:1733 length:861 start_codon:yes stop_codon:yes gene_type:complete